jgi:hypothetical protein
MDPLVLIGPVEAPLEPPLVDEADNLDVLFDGAGRILRAGGSAALLRRSALPRGIPWLVHNSRGVRNHGLVLAPSDKAHDNLDLDRVLRPERAKASEKMVEDPVDLLPPNIVLRFG